MKLIDLNDQNVHLKCKVAPQKMKLLAFGGNPIINIIHEITTLKLNFMGFS